MKRAIAYIRVSTQQQASSGLGLEAQQATLAKFCATYGYEVVHEYREIESGRKSARPVLKAATAHARREKATLLIATLDRLARNMRFIAELMDSDVEFRACDLPEANRLLLHIMAAVAENEATMISARTKRALAAARERGTKLGGTNPRCRNLRPQDQRKGAKMAAQAKSRAVAEAYEPLIPRLVEFRSAGLSLSEIAQVLNDRGEVNASGRPWNKMQVSRLLVRGNASGNT